MPRSFSPEANAAYNKELIRLRQRTDALFYEVNAGEVRKAYLREEIADARDALKQIRQTQGA